MTDPKQIVRDGYDKVSLAYRSGNEADDDPVYARWTARLANDLAPSARLLDLGCGCGIPTTRALAALGSVVGVDISPVQIERARSLVPAAEFLCEDMSTLRFPQGSFDAVVSFYAIIHVPLEEQPDLFKRIASWLKPGGLFVATLGSGAWTGTEQDWLGVEGAEMYWSHADSKTYKAWLAEAGMELLTDEHIAEAGSPLGHHVFYAKRKPDSLE
ncbi:class I SAM-dependent methyltransferase [Variovorax sp. DAIF25]|uniref:class I SAM-dependent methyltransferase n=1 Tax=Variovorax sp. DAIF25 TaxID=3080983 RepID=UPI003D6AEC62